MCSDEVLQGLIPPPKLAIRTNNWAKAVHEQYKHYSHNLATRDRSVTVRILTSFSFTTFFQ